MKEELGEEKYGIFKGKKFYIIYTVNEEGEEIPFKVRWKGVFKDNIVITVKNILELVDDKLLSPHQLFSLYCYWSKGEFSPVRHPVCCYFLV